MNEQQIEDFEKFCAKHFPKGALLAGLMPDGSLHVLFESKDDEAEVLLDYLSDLIKEKVENLPDEDWEDD